MPSVIRTFIEVPKDVRDWTKYLSGLFFARTFEATVEGFTFTQTTTVTYTVSGGIAVLNIPTVSATSNQPTLSLLTLPKALLPERDQECIVRVKDNGTVQLGTAFIYAGSARINFGVGALQANFTSAGTKGIGGPDATDVVITYALD